jgi:DNA-binding SARP family transcriptional activator
VSVEVRVLGSLEVLCGGSPVVISGAKERALVVLLALREGRIVPVERLIEWLWDGRPPASADATLRVLISRVRKALGTAGAGRVIHTRAPGYVLMVDEVDVHRFELLTARGRSELAAGHPRIAADTVSEALELWRGDRLAEAGYGQLAAESTRWEEERLAAEEVRAEAGLECGRHADLVGGLEVLCRLHPLRERLWAHWILALYRCGRQADALAAYRRLRTTLGDELGIDPSVPLRQLEAAILAQDRALAAPQAGEPEGEPKLPVSALEVSLPIPAPLTVSETVACLGRDSELNRLRAAWQRVLAGELRLVLVRGEAGVGKSRLTREWAREAHRQGAVVLYACCDEDLAVPYRPIRECLNHYFSGVSDRRLAEHERHRLGEVTRLVPELTRRVPDLPRPPRTDPEAERYMLFSAVVQLLGEIAAQSPVALVLDDLHWADLPTLQLLRHLGAAAPRRMLILATYRDSEVVPRKPLTSIMAALCREPTVAHLRLTGLTQLAVASIVEAMAGGVLDEAGKKMARAVAEDSDGNAFLVVEQVRHLQDAGVLVRTSDGRATAVTDLASAGLPHTVQQVVAGRLESLHSVVGDGANTMLTVASIIGKQFDVGILCAACDVEEAFALDVLEAAGRQALVVEATGHPATFRFAHDTIRRVLYQQLGATQRARLHRRVGEALERVCGDNPGEQITALARHFLAGRPSDPDRVVKYACGAGDRALAALAPDEAVRWFEVGIAALDGRTGDRQLLHCLLGLSEAKRQLGAPGAREILLDVARRIRQIDEPQLLIRAALASYRGFFARPGRIDSELVELLEAAIEACPNGPDRARLLSRLAAEMSFHPDLARRTALAKEAVDVARRSGNAGALLDALARPTPALLVPELAKIRLSRLREAQAVADRVDDLVARYWAAHYLGLTLLEHGDIQGVDEALRRADQIAAQVGQPMLQWSSSYARFAQALLAGDTDNADRLMNHVLRIGTDSHQLDPNFVHTGLLFVLRWHQSRLDELVPVLTDIAMSRPDFLPVRAPLAFAEAVAGDRERARRLLRSRPPAAVLPRTARWLMTTCLWAETAAELDEESGVDDLYRRLLPWRELFATNGWIPFHCVSHSLGRLAALQGRLEVAEEHFATALAVHHRMRAPFCITATRCARQRLPVNP